MLIRVALISCFATTISAQQTRLVPQNDTWNSSIELTSAQTQAVNLSGIAANNVAVGLNFERSNWATGSVSEDEFYQVPANATNAKPGTVVKVQSFTNTSTYTLPPNTALSRIIFITEDINGTAIPASAYVLWPYLPLTQPDGKYPFVSWGHGTSGDFAECAPSHIRNLWYQYSAPYALALAGYVVVAPDYYGLGINETADGKPIYHPYLAAQAHGTDLLYAATAAQQAFPNLSENFVVMGHSQGGAAAWGAAVKQTQLGVPGYLGSIAGSPTTNISGEVALSANDPNQAPTLPFYWANALQGLIPNYNLSRILTTEGLAQFELARDLGMCNSAIGELLLPGTANITLQHDWATLPELQAYFELTDLGNQEIAGPMLVLQGTADPAVPEPFTTGAVETLCTLHPGSGVQYLRFDGVTHVPVLYASQRLWLEWLAGRFQAAGNYGNHTAPGSGGKAGGPCSFKNYTSTPFPVSNYQKDLEYFLELANEGYQVA